MSEALINQRRQNAKFPELGCEALCAGHAWVHPVGTGHHLEATRGGLHEFRVSGKESHLTRASQMSVWEYSHLHLLMSRFESPVPGLGPQGAF